MAIKRFFVVCLLVLVIVLNPFMPYSSVQAYAPDGTWEELSLGGGEVIEIAINPTNRQVMYVAVGLDLVYKSVDGGETWSFSGKGMDLPSLEIICIAIDPLNPSVLYAGGSLNAAAILYKSTDAGTTWTRSDTTIKDVKGPVSYIIADPSAPGLVYALTFFSQFYRSTNGGADWVLSMTGFPWPLESHGLTLNKSSLQASSLHICDMYAHYRSTDSGLTWSTGGTFGCQAIAAQGLGSDVLYAVGLSNKISRVYKSTDDGKNWTEIYSFGEKLWLAVIAVDPTNPSKLYLGIDGGSYELGKFYVSQNGGTSWAEEITGMVNPNVRAIKALSGSPVKIWLGTRGGGILTRASDGSSWLPKNVGLTAVDVSKVIIQPDLTSTLYAGTDGAGISKSVDGGATWQECNQGLGWPEVKTLVMDPNDYQTLFAGLVRNGIYRSTDGCQTWIPVNTGIPTAYTVYDLEMPSDQPDHLYAAVEFFVYKSTDYGANWARTDSAVVPAYGIGVDPFNQDRMVAVADYGIRYTDDSWATFTESASQIDAYMSDAIYNPGKEGLIYAYSSNGGGIYQSANGGVTWTLDDYFAPPSELKYVYNMAIDPTDPAKVFALSKKVISVSEDSGNAWEPEITAFPAHLVLKSMAMDPAKTGTRFLGTASGLYVFKPAPVVVENKNFLPMIVR